MFGIGHDHRKPIQQTVAHGLQCRRWTFFVPRRMRYLIGRNHFVVHFFMSFILDRLDNRILRAQKIYNMRVRKCSKKITSKTNLGYLVVTFYVFDVLVMFVLVLEIFWRKNVLFFVFGQRSCGTLF